MMPEISEKNPYTEKPITCKICAYGPSAPRKKDMGQAIGNTRRFMHQTFTLWKCPKCLSIHAVDPVDPADIYSDYPLNKRVLDVYAKGTYTNLLRRLSKRGLTKTDHILDYGCGGNGIFIQFLQKEGYPHVTGYDPFVSAYAQMPDKDQKFDWVIANDVIEHCDNPVEMMQHALGFVKENGHFYAGTADSQDVNMDDLEPHITRLHLPFHRVIINQAMLLHLGLKFGLEPVDIYLRSYMDTLRPFSNYRFLDEFNKALGHDLDKAIDPASASIVIKKPKLLYYAFFGYFFPSAHEPAVLWHYSG